jgi:hypothetical protein
MYSHRECIQTQNECILKFFFELESVFFVFTNFAENQFLLIFYLINFQ